MIKIAHASIDENGKTEGGTAGDQRGNEVASRDWYNKPWSCVIRFKDSIKAERLASFMEKAVDNNNIGYDQGQRMTLHEELKKVNFDVSKVSKPCETDCSALVSDGCIYAGVEESALLKWGNLSTTHFLRERLQNTNLVTVFTTKDYTEQTNLLKRGDILLNDSKHVAVVLGDSRKTAPIAETRVLVNLRMLKKGSKGGDVSTLQILLNEKGKASLEVDGDFGTLTAQAVANYQRKHSLEVDSVVGSETWSHLLEAT